MTQPLPFVTLGLGSNLGDRAAHLRRACCWLREWVLMDAVESPVVETPALGPPQPSYLNQVIHGRCPLTPRELLRGVKALEVGLGRTATFRWGPRVIDIDILDYDGESIDLPDLQIPHVGIAERSFVLEPWNEIAPEQWLPRWEASVSQLWNACRRRIAESGKQPS